ncbi:hypothetical protein BAUCODRAFT_26667 [Baudoinia panamericana UAMH 10762]|uniref:NADP-dependent oxidoreductase domain-containing protein n=1 Tax=Baudoinia panamericana (strain UAMH 10762) TaxID=717646 RepID=M2N3R8_BAUPA|nr:uncharacterized protein BAUCODRAFT_26667 [Baudoinia panamericana UAMH 10762]EMC93365.1 hypothetical protein BAUCODRAFT_26667 [Baudoinia panamericana UAMH 10762]
MPGIANVFGGGGINPGEFCRCNTWGEVEALHKCFDILEKGDCKTIDTAALYGMSEELLGKAKAGDRLTIDTKQKGGFDEIGATKDNVVAQAKHSKEMLGCNVDIYYIHAPDHKTPLEDTLAGINEVYKSGFFKRFGLSNYKAEDVQKVYDICKEKGYPLPKVYQGNYSAVARKQEELLFPTLRKLGIAFYAYSPMAGGFLTKTKQQITDGVNRFSNEALGGMYRSMYNKPAYLEALAQWEQIAKDEGCSRAELAYRWVKYNSPLKAEHGDAIIFGASSYEQLEQTLQGLNNGPLSDKAVKAIDGVWETIAHEAPLDNYHDFAAKSK